MNEKKIEPTDAMVADVGVVKAWFGLTSTRDLLGLALNHPDAAGLFECDHTDYVHVDEAATRVEAAREEGWDEAAQHIYNKGWEGVDALRKANPHRPAPVLPTAGGAVIVPADGRDYIEATANGVTYRAREAMLAYGNDWHASWRTDSRNRACVSPEHIVPGTWKVEEN